MDNLVVNIESVTKNYRSKEAVKNLTLKIQEGTSYGLIGRNGAGKTTTLRLIMGMLRPTKGTVSIFNGDPITQAEKVKLHVGYLAEDQIFPNVLRPIDLFRFFADCYPTWDNDFAKSLIDRFSVPTTRNISTLSKGEQRQVALICAVAHRPKLLVLDEPGGGLDPVVRRSFLEQVIEHLSNEKSTIIFSSHNLQEVERIATRIGIIHNGSLILDKSLDDLRENSCQVLTEANSTNKNKIKKSIPECISVTHKENAWLLTLVCNEAQALQKIENNLKCKILESRNVSLEDIFISLAGDEK